LLFLLDIQGRCLSDRSGMETEINVWLCVPILKGIFSAESIESDILVYCLGTTLPHLFLRCEDVHF